MTTQCDPKGLCPQCGYQNGPGAERCLRCRQVLKVLQGCSGHCTDCLLKALMEPPAKKA